MRILFLIALLAYFCPIFSTTAWAEDSEQISKNGVLSNVESFMEKKSFLWGYRDKKTKQVLIEPRFNAASAFMANSKLAVAGVKQGGSMRYGYIDLSGEWVVKPRFKKAYDFYDTLAIVEIDDENFGLIDSQGNIKLRVHNIAYFGSRNRPFISGLVPVEIGGLWGYADTEGRLAIKPQYSESRDFDQTTGLARVHRADGTGLFINTSGNILIEEIKETGDGGFKGRVGKKWGLYGQNGECLIRPEYDDIGRFSKDGTAVKSGEKWGFARGWSDTGRKADLQKHVDDASKLMVEPRFEAARSFASFRHKGKTMALAAVKVDGKWGYIGQDGQFVISPKFDDAREFRQKNLDCNATCGKKERECAMAVIEFKNVRGCTNAEGVYSLD